MMSTKVTWLKQYSTSSSFGHTHTIAQEDKSVPSEEEFNNLSAKVEKISSAIRDLKTQLSDISTLKQTLANQQKEIAKLTEELFAKHIGDIADLAKARTDAKKAEEEYRKAHANAQGSSNK